MGIEREIGNPDYVGVWFDRNQYYASSTTPTAGPFIIYLDGKLQGEGTMVDQIGLARLTRGRFDEKTEFTKTYMTDSRQMLMASRKPYKYSGVEKGGVISGTWEITLRGRKYSGQFLMQSFGTFFKDRTNIKSGLANAWLDAQIEFLQNKYLAGIEAKLIHSARKEVLVIA